jgi:alpha-L-fucosidase
MFDLISGYQPGEACSRRDLIEDLYQSLSKYDIDLYLYYTGDGPWKDNKSGKAFGFTAPRENVPREFVERWASVLKEYSQRYGSKVKGWWIDGCYTYFGYNDDLMKCYVDAVKTGNPEALIALNGGVRDPVIRYSKYDDFTCGELNDFIYLPQDRFIDGAQAHILAPLGVSSREDGFDGWCKPGVKRSKEYMRDYVKTVNARGGVVTVDVCLYRDGSMDPQQLEVLKDIG